MNLIYLPDIMLFSVLMLLYFNFTNTFRQKSKKVSLWGTLHSKRCGESC